ncbi:MAG: ABC transporter ATP-binding protein/permease [Oscillospiraceae bacterium]|nr:ABC transporter ATP-binding protein/permease [Oscillospiraceae bacterium]
MGTEKLTFAQSVKIFGKSLKVSLKVRGAGSILVSILGFAMAFLPMLIAIYVRNFSNEIQGAYGRGEEYVSSIIGVFVILSALYVVQLLWRSLNSYFEVRNRVKIQMFMRERILRCTCDVQYKYILNYDDFKKRINFVSTEAGERVANSVGTTITWLQDIITFISIITVLWAVDVWIVIILVAACIPAILISAKFSDEQYWAQGFYVLPWLMSNSAFFEATMSTAINDTRFFGAYPWLRGKFERLNAEYIGIKNRVTKKHVFFNSLADIFRSGVYVVILLIAARQIFDNPVVGIGAFMLVFTMASQLQDVTARIFTAAAQFSSNAAYMRDFFYLDLLEYEMRGSAAKPQNNFSIQFKDVDFTYPNTERKILQNLNVHIREGEKVAIVGENGSGKTTFVSLLCALYKPDNGDVTMGGESIYDNISKMRKALSAVFQDFARYETTIRANIVISDLGRGESDEQIRTAAENTGAWEFIEAQDNGLDEVVGTFSPSGNNLSGGQWQKVALTRCIYRSDAKIMILDEPTAALDPVAEAELYRHFTDIIGDRTTILISHRLGITQLVDRVLVFDDGRIVEDGTHSELLEKDGLYARMYHAQAQWYE